MKARPAFLLISFAIIAAVALTGIWHPRVWWCMVLFGPLILLGYSDMLQKKQAIKRNFPVIGHGRFMLEKIRPEIMQYFVETDTAGRPFNRMLRSMVYQRAKKVTDTTPFGTQLDVYQSGYEWMDHSMYAYKIDHSGPHPRVLVGGPDCKKPYSASLLNSSAMSYGSLSRNAVMAINKGAKIDNFAQNTGEGGLSQYHLKYGGDIIWQIGTGYFGARNKDGTFSETEYAKRATLENVKMIELKISQGAKPGHGGILPASKNTPEIAEIRGVEPHTEVQSPPAHTAFSNATELVHFLKVLRDASGGKPVGFKICIGRESEFIDICKAMIKTGVKPDFITIDGGEGGTGAAPVEFSNYIGRPLRDGLSFAYNTLVGYDLKKDIKLIGSGKIVNGFHMARTLALGADMCNSARAMMLAVGCIQALQCNKNTCPVGVATQDETLMKGLDIESKALRIANYHHSTMNSFVELIGALAISSPSELNRSHINRRISINNVKRYDQLYPYTRRGEYLEKEPESVSYKKINE
ncbi:MAG: FMN-binding glutamate synthase family protein [Bacteroidia bacterium]